MRWSGNVLSVAANALAAGLSAWCVGVLATGGVADFGAAMNAALGVVALGAVWVGLVVRFAWLSMAERGGELPRGWCALAHLGTIPILACAVFVLSQTTAPTRILLWTHRTALEREAQNPRQIAPVLQFPARFGLLKLHAKRRQGNTAFLAVRTGGFFFSTSYFVLARTLDGKVPTGSMLQIGACQSIYTEPAHRLDGNWFWQRETCDYD